MVVLNVALQVARHARVLTLFAAMIGILSGVCVSQVHAQQTRQAPADAAKPLTEADLRNMPIEKACPPSARSAVAGESLTGPDSTDQVNKLAEAVKICMERLKIMLSDLMAEGGDEAWKKMDGGLIQAIAALQSRIDELKRSGGLIEIIKLYLNRLEIIKNDLPRTTPQDNKAELDRLTKEHQDVIAETKRALEALESMTDIMNTKVIALESQRPQLARELMLTEYRRAADAIKNLNRIIEDTNTSLNAILSKNRNAPVN